MTTAFNDPPRAPRVGPVITLVRQLISFLGPEWVWDDTNEIGVRVRWGNVITLKVEDIGSGIVQIEAVMPNRFLPVPAFTRPFAVGAAEIARKILGETVPDYRYIIAQSDEHQDGEARWKAETREHYTQIGAELDMPAQIEEIDEPGVHMSVLFQRGPGNSIRINAQPGSGPGMAILAPSLLDLWPLVKAWKRIGEPPETPEAKLTRAIERVFGALGNERAKDELIAALEEAGVFWNCGCGWRNGPADTTCAECKIPRPTT